jgi:hypothetical protein
MIDLITVVYKPEVPLIKIQASSLDKNFSYDDIKTIYIVVNDEDSVTNEIDKSWYGKFSDKVVIYPYSIFGYVSRIEGWENQQLCKILAASRSTCEWTLVLDAKTFFTKPCKKELLFDAENRACTNLLKPVPVFDSAKTSIEKLYNVELDYVIGPGGVPFFFHTATVLSMIKETESITGKSFIDFFQENVRFPNLITEFYLYSGYVKRKFGKFDDLYAQKQRWTCVNIADWEIDNFDQLFNNMQKFLTLTVSIASKAWVLLRPEQQDKYLEFLKNRNLITNIQNTQKELNTVIN